MTPPRGSRNPKRPRFVKESGADHPEMALRFGHELGEIMKALGPDAPDEDDRVIPMLRGDRCFFIISNSMYTWQDGVALRVIEAHDGERYEAWRDGKKLGQTFPPREAHWN
jgi:hypothetical protein